MTNPSLESVMTPNPACCKADTLLVEVAQTMRDRDCGQLPVVDERGLPVGVITDRDIAVRAVADGRSMDQCRAQDVMSHPAATVSRDASLTQTMEMMERLQVRRVPVVGEDGTLAGIVAQADIALQARGEDAAEVVREISRPH